MKDYYKENYPEFYQRIIEHEKAFSNIGSLYHVTTESSAKNILKTGLSVSFCGDIHGSMEARPDSNTIYLSKYEYANNLNSNLFDKGEPIVVLEIDPSCLSMDSIYPDDGMFAAFGQEEYLEDEVEVSEVFSISIDEATAFFNELCTKTNDEIAEFLKPIWSIYLAKEGEISVSHDIPGFNVKSLKMYDNSKLNTDLFKSQFQDNALAKAWSKKINTSLEKSIGDGIHGTAYLTKSGKVLKITDDHSEFYNSFDLLGANNQHIVDIYQVQLFKDGKYGILQEYVDTKQAFKDYEELMEYAEDELGYDIDTLFELNLSKNEIPEHLFKLYEDVKSFYVEANKYGVCSTDLTEGNIGKRKNGNYVVFDISSEEDDMDIINDRIKSIKASISKGNEITL